MSIRFTMASSRNGAAVRSRVGQSVTGSSAVVSGQLLAVNHCLSRKSLILARGWTWVGSDPIVCTVSQLRSQLATNSLAPGAAASASGVAPVAPDITAIRWPNVHFERIASAQPLVLQVVRHGSSTTWRNRTIISFSGSMLLYGVPLNGQGETTP